ncbi:hypothetical protein BJ138DRAFT_1106946, partial [Hygrophoropsis aurantiaca]
MSTKRKQKQKTIPKPKRNTGLNPNNNPMESQLGLQEEEPETAQAFQFSQSQQASQTQQFAYPQTQQPTYSQTQQPTYPQMQQPTYSQTQQPMYPQTQQPTYQPSDLQSHQSYQQPYQHSYQQPGFDHHPPDSNYDDRDYRSQPQAGYLSDFEPSQNYGTYPPPQHHWPPSDTSDNHPPGTHVHSGADILRRAQVAAQSARAPIVPGAAQLNQPTVGTATQSRWGEAYTVEVFRAPRRGEGVDQATGVRRAGVIHPIGQDITVARRRSSANAGGAVRRASSSRATSQTTQPPPATSHLVNIDNQLRKDIIADAKDEVRRQMFRVGAMLNNRMRDQTIRECIEYGMNKRLQSGVQYNPMTVDEYRAASSEIVVSMAALRAAYKNSAVHRCVRGFDLRPDLFCGESEITRKMQQVAYLLNANELRFMSEYTQNAYGGEDVKLLQNTTLIDIMIDVTWLEGYDIFIDPGNLDHLFALSGISVWCALSEHAEGTYNEISFTVASALDKYEEIIELVERFKLEQPEVYNALCAEIIARGKEIQALRMKEPNPEVVQDKVAEKPTTPVFALARH